jgi:hypothetical protein
VLKAYALTEKGTRREALGPHIASFRNSSTSRRVRDERAAAELLLLVSIQLPVNSWRKLAPRPGFGRGFSFSKLGS